MSNEEYYPETDSDDDSNDLQPSNKKPKIMFILNPIMHHQQEEELKDDFNINDKIYKKYRKDIHKIQDINKSNSYSNHEKILTSKFSLEIKARLFEKLNNSDRKNVSWVNQVLKLPVGIYKNIFDNGSNLNEFLCESRKLLDKYIYGMENVKEELIDFIVKCVHNKINGKPIKGTVLALKGPRGVGKTKICKALSSIFNLPLKQISLGGMSDSMVLLGHDSTYIGSKCGRIGSIFQECGCMNPIILLEEIDKISDSTSGVDGVLTHMLDETQNKEFIDLYFEGIPIDLSSVLFIVTFNDEDKIDPVVLNRMKIIEVKGLPLIDKVNVVKKFILPDMNYNNFNISDDIITYIIKEKTKKEEGMRNIVKMIETVINRLNTIKILNTCQNIDDISYNFSYKECLKEFKSKEIIVNKKIIDIILRQKKENELWRQMYI